jgi:rhodanese-related sulfurtransferase
MQTLLLRALVLLFIAMAIAAAHSWKTGVVLHFKPRQTVDLAAALRADEERASSAAGAAALTGGEEEPESALVNVSPAAVETPAAAPQTPELPDTQPPSEASASDSYITVEQARQLFDRQFLAGRQVVFIDARARNYYEQGHIEGAMSLPVGEYGAATPRKVRDYLPGTTVVIYCQGEQCSDSHDLAKRLQHSNLDIAPILILKAGYPAWAEAGHPIMTGPEVGWD